MNTCAYIPKVKNNNGEIVESRLFSDLLSLSKNRKQTILSYTWLKERDYSKFTSVEYDDNGEPTIDFIHKHYNIANVIGEDNLLHNLSINKGLLNKDGSPKVFNSKEEASALMSSFNNNNPLSSTYTSEVTTTFVGDKGHEIKKYKVIIVPKLTVGNNNINKSEINETLNNRIKEIIQDNGFSIGAMTDITDRLVSNGVFDTETARVTANGLIEVIKLASGFKGEKALPEEFAHFIFEAIQNTPLATRIMNMMLSNPELSERVLGNEYQKYSDVYKGDSTLIAKEAIGKLIAKHFLNQQPSTKDYLGKIVDRLLELIKKIFGKKTKMADDLSEALEYVDKKLSGVAKGALSGKYNAEIRNYDPSVSPIKLYQLDSQIERDRTVLSKIIEEETKRVKVYEENKKDNKEFVNRQMVLLSELESSLYKKEYIDGIYKFLEHASEEMNKMELRMKDLRQSPDYMSNPTKSAGVIRDAHNYIAAYEATVKHLRVEMRKAALEGDDRLENKVADKLQKMEGIMKQFSTDFTLMSVPLVKRYLSDFMGSHSITLKQGKNKGKTLTIDDIIDGPSVDIGFFDRWIKSMADSNDNILKLLDLGVKKAHSSARVRAIEISKRLQEAQLELEKSGIKSTEWMMKRDSKGNLTGNFISELDIDGYREALGKETLRLQKLYTDSEGRLNKGKYTNDLYKWKKAHTTVVNGKTKINFKDKTFDTLTPAQVKYYNTVMELKSEMDSFLPDKYSKDRELQAPQIRKDFVDRVRGAKSAKEATSAISESLRDSFIKREDDIQYGSVDFSGNAVEYLPIFYTHKLSNMNDLSTDVTSSMVAYATMAIDYDEMNKVVDMLELTRDVIKEREVLQTNNGKPIMEKINAAGRNFERNITKSGENTRIMEKVNDFFSSQVYGRYIKDEGTAGKTADSFMHYVAITNLGFNVLAGISNVANASMMSNIEAVAQEFFTAKDLLKADKEYAKSLPSLVSQIGNRVQTNKMYLFNEMFGVIQGQNDKKLKNLQMNKKGLLRLADLSHITFLMECGEHWVQSRTALAVAQQFKMLSPEGKQVSLYEAFEVKETTNPDKSISTRLSIKDGYKKVDGSEFSENDRFALENKITTINRKLNGTYNRADKAAIQRVAAGRAAFMFRNWMVDAFNRRFSSSSYDFSLHQEYEGYYNSSARFMKGIFTDLIHLKFNIGAHWNEMTSNEKANCKRALTEVSQLMLISIALGCIKWGEGPDRPWLERLSEYQLRRLKTELGAMTPNIGMLEQMFTLIKSPSAGVDAANRLLNLLKFTTWFDELEGGQFRGHYKIEKYINDATPLRSVNRAFNPELGIPFLK